MIFVVVPAFNEQEKIGRVIRGLFEHGYKNIVVVDDGSEDDTATRAEEAGAIVLRHVINRGQGAALQTGNEYALKNGAQTVVHFDADGQFNPADIKGALETQKSNDYDVVLGSRFLDSRSSLPWTKRHLILPIGRLINFFLTGVFLSDAHNGFRIMNSRSLEKINITQDGMAHNTEIVALINKLNLSYTEFPVEVCYYEYGQGIIGGVKTVYDVIIKKII